MAMSLADIHKGAMVRLVEDEKGVPLHERPLGLITKVEYQGGNPTVWNAIGLKKDAEKKSVLFVDFGDTLGVKQIEPRQLVLHQHADMAAQSALKNRVDDERAMKAHLDKPILTDPKRLDGKTVNPMTLEVTKKKSVV